MFSTAATLAPYELSSVVQLRLILVVSSVAQGDVVYAEFRLIHQRHRTKHAGLAQLRRVLPRASRNYAGGSPNCGAGVEQGSN